jgi:hypothetical protein
MGKLVKQAWGISPHEFFAGWWKVPKGGAPLLSIEITREYPLKCPGCYSHASDHLGDNVPGLREFSDLRGAALINGVLGLVREHRPLLRIQSVNRVFALTLTTRST